MNEFLNLGPVKFTCDLDGVCVRSRADLCVVPEEDPEYKHVTFQTCLEFWLFPSQSKFSGKTFYLAHR